MIYLMRNSRYGDKFNIIRFLHSFRNTTAHINAKKARQMFLDYYVKDNNYSFVKSSPVMPLHDATLPFVNAGMNQFKGVFLNTHVPLHDKVANYQKCIRIGGKHNDLDAVGQDGYHHTFFEMLGNWTFKSCSKEEQCKLAWKLLTDVFRINKHQLYVTYFGGNETLGLPADLECRDIWRKLGLPHYRILPFDMRENFWEMGATGPCGPCTEIHYDHLRAPNRSQFVNKGLHELVELWNIVFIEYKREPDGKIVPLPDKHVDTGMGFERLVAVLQKKISNYDTDVFNYIFKAIFKNCQDIPQYKSVFGEHDWNSLHSNYRILADHIRMISISLGDGMIPEENQKLRKVLRRAFNISENVFKKPSGLVKELSNYVIDNLGTVYAELESNSKQIHTIIDYEEDIYQELRRNAISDWSLLTKKNPELAKMDILEMPGLVQAYKDIKSNNVSELSAQYAYKLYDTFGLDEDSISNLCSCLKIQFNPKDFHAELEATKHRSKSATILDVQIPEMHDGSLKTEDSFKYGYKRTDNGYLFDTVEVQVLKILQSNVPVNMIKGGADCALVLDKTNLYHEAGGQIADEGRIDFTVGEFRVRDLKRVNDCILHVGNWHSDKELSPLAKGKLSVDETKRMRNMQNHTATHILNAVLKQLKGATCQKSSKVTDRYLNLDVGVFSDKLSPEDITLIETKVNAIINEGIDVNVKETDSQNLWNENVTVIPGEIYPDKNIRLIEVKWNDNLVSREPCCGTHVMNTRDIEAFCITAAKSLGRSTVSIHALTGQRAKKAKQLGTSFLEEIQAFEKNVKDNKHTTSDVEIALFKKRIVSDVEDENVIPLLTKMECLKILENISQSIKSKTRDKLKELISLEMKTALETKILKSDMNNNFIVHYLHTSGTGETVPLQKATKVVPGMPVMIITCTDNIVKARCTVPIDYKTANFTAEKWMQVVSDVFNTSVQPPKGQDKELVCNLKGKHIKDTEWKPLLNKSLEAAEQYAKKHL